MTGELALIPEMGPSETNIANVSFSEVRHFFHPDPNPGCDKKKKIQFSEGIRVEVVLYVYPTSKNAFFHVSGSG